jgi:hypothetical protein
LTITLDLIGLGNIQDRRGNKEAMLKNLNFLSLRIRIRDSQSSISAVQFFSHIRVYLRSFEVHFLASPPGVAI